MRKVLNAENQCVGQSPHVRPPIPTQAYAPVARGVKAGSPQGRGATAGETLLDCGVGLEGKSMKEWRWDSVCARCEGLVVQEGDDVRCLNCGARLFPEPAVPLQEKGQAGGGKQP